MHKSVYNYLKLFLTKDTDLKIFTESDIEYLTYHITNQEEKCTSIRDNWGNWEFPYTSYDFSKPYVDMFILSKLNEHNIPQKTIWPENKKFAISISHDVDLVTQFSYKSSQRQAFKIFKTNTSIKKKLIDSKFGLTFFKNLFLLFKRSDPLWSYEKWIQEMDKYYFKSTFFFFTKPKFKDIHKVDCDYLYTDNVKFMGKKMCVKDMIKYINDAGFEIGVHGSFNTHKDEVLLKNQKEVLEKIIDKKVVSTRQHWLRYEINTTPIIHLKAGIENDSTIGFNRNIGFRNGCSFPYFLADKHNQIDVLEFPLILMDCSLFTNDSLHLNEEFAIKKSIDLLDKVEKVGGCYTINFHPNYLNDSMWWNTFKAILHEAKKRNAYCGTFKEINTIIKNNII